MTSEDYSGMETTEKVMFSIKKMKLIDQCKVPAMLSLGWYQLYFFGSQEFQKRHTQSVYRPSVVRPAAKSANSVGS